MWLARPGFSRCERGSGTTLALTVLLLMVALSMTLMMALAAVNQTGRMQGVADAAALAAADAARGIIAAAPCELAQNIAAAQGVMLSRCDQNGEVVTINFSARVLMFELVFSAQAGPP